MFNRPQSNDLIKSPGIFAKVAGGRKETPPLGTAELLYGYEKFPWIRGISDLIGRGIGATKWQLSDGTNEIQSHPMRDLLARPNPIMSGRAFLKWSGTHFALTNEIFWLVERNLMGLPIELWPVPAHWVIDIPKGGDPDGEYEIAFSGARAKFRAIDIIYIRDFNPANPYGRSSSPAKALGDEIESDEFAAKYVKSFFLNNAKPDLLIYSEDKDVPIDPVSAKRLENSWMAKLRGVRNSFKPFFLPGKVGVKELQTDLKSMDLIAQRKWWRDVTLQVYAIPPEVMGVIESSNRATIEAADFLLAKNVIVPRIEIIQDALTTELAPMFDKRIQVLFENPIKEDREHRLAVTKAHPYAFDVDEIRQDAGREALESGSGKTYPHQFNTLFSETPGGDSSAGEKGQKLKAPNGAGSPWRLSETKNIDDDIEELILVLGSDEFNPAVSQANLEAVTSFGQGVIDQVGVSASFNVSAPKVVEFLAEQSSDRIVGLVNETTRSLLRKTLAAGSAEGEGAAQLAKRIGDVFEDARGVRAFKIARTETVRASNFGALEGMNQSGVKQKQWLTVGDGDVRSSHQSMNGQTVETVNRFTSGNGAQTMYPGGFGIAAEDIECRCSILAVIATDTASISAPSLKDFERERQPFERLMEYAYVKGFDAQEIAVLELFNLLQETQV